MSFVSAKSTILLFFAGLIGKAVGAVYRIPLSNFLGAEGMGIYQMAFPIYSFLLTIITGGISVLIAKRVATAKAKNNFSLISKNFYIAKKLSLILGVALFAFLLIFAYPISYLQGNINAFWGYIAISLGFVFASLLGAYRGYYQGFGNMTPTAVSQIIEQVIKLIFGLTFAGILVKFGVLWGVFGALLGVAFSEIVCFIYFLIINKKVQKFSFSLNKGDFNGFFKDFLPIGATFGVAPLGALVDSFLVVNLLVLSGLNTSFATSLYGIETGMILPLINMPNILISAITISAVPEISYKKEKNEDYKTAIHNMLKIVYIFILPCCVGMFLLADSIITLIYPTLNSSQIFVATNLLKLSVFEMFFLCFVGITNSILQGLGKTKVPLVSMLVGLGVKILLATVLILNKSINIYGIVFASFVGYFVTTIINIKKIKKESGTRLGFAEILLPIFASTIMALIVVLMLNLKTSPFGLLWICFIIIVAVCVYFGVLLALGQFKIKELKNMLQKVTK